MPNNKKLERCLNKFICKPIDNNLLVDIKKALINYYDNCGYPLVKAVVPAGQEITNGEIKIYVSINKINSIQVSGCKHFSDKYILSCITAKQGNQLEINQMSNDLEWINQNPFRTTTLTLVPTDEYDKCDVILKTSDSVPVSVYTGYENTGNQVAGNSRFYVGLNFGNLFWRSHQFNNLFISGASVSKFWLYVGSYIIPTSWKGKFEFYGSFIRTGASVTVNDLTGKNWTLATRYRQYFNRHYEVFSGYEFKRSNNFSTYAKQLAFNNFFDISQFLVGIDINYKYQFGSTFLGIILYGSPGNMTAFNKSSIFQIERKGTKASYVYGKIKFEQLFYLPCSFTLFLNGAFQQSTTKLLPSEEFSLGGFYTIRGYDENQAFGDNGFLLRTELRFPGFKWCKHAKFFQNLQFLSFIDFGYTYDVDKSIVDKDTVFMASVGPGLRYYLRENLQVRFDYGFQLDAIIRTDGQPTRHSRGHVGAKLSF